MTINWLKSMRNSASSYLVIGCACAALGLGTSSAQAATNSASANAKSTIITALTITKNTDLNFGSIVPGATAGKIAIAPTAAGTQVCTTAICTGGGNTAAKFTLAGAAGYTAVMTIPATVALTGPGPSMTATLSNSLTANKMLLTGTAADAFYVGGTLSVGTSALQTSGAYSGTFTVTVAYQ